MTMEGHPLLAAGGDDHVALIDAASGKQFTYGELRSCVADRMQEVAHLRGHVVFLGMTADPGSVIDYLALTAVGSTAALLDPSTDPAILDRWAELYAPADSFGFDQPVPASGGEARPTRPERVLLATSGSTGSPKFVRLSGDAVVANALQIADALRLDASERALVHLPLFYSFGLSILNSHLSVGASLVLTRSTALRPEFWDAIREHEVSSLSGVPYSFEMFRRMKFAEMDLPSLRHVTQAGGRLHDDRIVEIHAALADRGVDFWVMYGQTEASARIAVLPPELLPDAVGSVGWALPGGSLRIDEPDADGVGEVVYRGPNVMMGYAHDASDVDGVDQLDGELRTGDLGRLEGDGRLRITGRLKRMAKVFGTRVSLDDIEARLSEMGTVAALDDDDGIRVFVESDVEIEGLSRQIERVLGFPPRAVRAEVVAQLPLTAAGKTDYQGLRNR